MLDALGGDPLSPIKRAQDQLQSLLHARSSWLDVLKAAGIVLGNASSVRAAFAALDTDGSGYLSREELRSALLAVSSTKKVSSTKERTRRSSTAGEGDRRSSMTEVQLAAFTAQIEQMILMIDSDGDGLISVEEIEQLASSKEFEQLIVSSASHEQARLQGIPQTPALATLVLTVNAASAVLQLCVSRSEVVEVYALGELASPIAAAFERPSDSAADPTQPVAIGEQLCTLLLEQISAGAVAPLMHLRSIASAVQLRSAALCVTSWYSMLPVPIRAAADAWLAELSATVESGALLKLAPHHGCKLALHRIGSCDEARLEALAIEYAHSRAGIKPPTLVFSGRDDGVLLTGLDSSFAVPCPLRRGEELLREPANQELQSGDVQWRAEVAASWVATSSALKHVCLSLASRGALRVALAGDLCDTAQRAGVPPAPAYYGLNSILLESTAAPADSATTRMTTVLSLAFGVHTADVQCTSAKEPWIIGWFINSLSTTALDAPLMSSTAHEEASAVWSASVVRSHASLGQRLMLRAAQRDEKPQTTIYRQTPLTEEGDMKAGPVPALALLQDVARLEAKAMGCVTVLGLEAQGRLLVRLDNAADAVMAVVPERCEIWTAESTPYSTGTLLMLVQAEEVVVDVVVTRYLGMETNQHEIKKQFGEGPALSCPIMSLNAHNHCLQRFASVAAFERARIAYCIRLVNNITVLYGTSHNKQSAPPDYTAADLLFLKAFTIKPHPVVGAPVHMERVELNNVSQLITLLSSPCQRVHGAGHTLRPVLLASEAGAGKSTLLRLAARMIAEQSASCADRLLAPLLLDSADAARSREQLGATATPAEVFAACIRAKAATPQEAAALFQLHELRSLVVLLDGYDFPLVDWLMRHGHGYPRLACASQSTWNADGSYVAMLQELSRGFHVVTVHADIGVPDRLQKRVQHASIEERAFFEHARKVPALVAMLLAIDDAGDLPRDLYELFDRATRSTLQRQVTNPDVTYALMRAIAEKSTMRHQKLWSLDDAWLASLAAEYADGWAALHGGLDPLVLLVDGKLEFAHGLQDALYAAYMVETAIGWETDDAATETLNNQALRESIVIGGATLGAAIARRRGRWTFRKLTTNGILALLPLLGSNLLMALHIPCCPKGLPTAEIARAVSRCTSLLELTLELYHPGADDMQPLADALGAAPLSSINLSRTSLKHPEAARIMQKLGLAQLCELRLDTCDLHVAVLIALNHAAASAREIIALRLLSLENNPDIALGEGGAKALASLVKAAVRLESLNLRGCHLQGDVGLKLAESVDNHPTLSSLQLAKTHLSEAVAPALAVALGQVSCRLQFLWLDENRSIGKKIEPLVTVLAKCKTLHQLGLSYCGLEPVHSSKLAESLGSNRILKTLDLAFNGVCIVPLLEALQSNTSLTSLVLDGNQWQKNEMGLANGDFLGANRGLQTLSLNDVKLGVDGMQAISAALRTNTTLTWLSIRDNAIGPRGGREVVDALKDGTGPLKHLDLTLNGLLGTQSQVFDAARARSIHVEIKMDELPAHAGGGGCRCQCQK